MNSDNMILSPHRTPPYRSPTPRTTTTTPPRGDPSPKRKRTESVSQPSETLRIQTDLKADLEDSVTGCDSPRSKIAEKLRDLKIDRASSGLDGASDAQPKIKRKRLITRPRIPIPAPSPSPVRECFVAETPDRRRSHREDLLKASVEIQEIPQENRQPSSSPPPAPENALASFRNCLKTASDNSDPDDKVVSPEQMPLLPSPKVMVSPPHKESIPERSLSPTQVNDDSMSLDQAALTWQDSEITGHEIDVKMDDDGLGINGIGFCPTPAMAYARSQKRKQQVNEWKAREAREARQRRIDRRRGGSGSDGPGGARRVVRFEEVG